MICLSEIGGVAFDFPHHFFTTLLGLFETLVADNNLHIHAVNRSIIESTPKSESAFKQCGTTGSLPCVFLFFFGSVATPCGFYWFVTFEALGHSSPFLNASDDFHIHADAVKFLRNSTCV